MVRYIPLVLALALAACAEKPTPPKEAEPTAAKAPEKKAEAPKPEENPVVDDSTLKAHFAPLPEVMESKDNPLTDEKVALGQMLYFDARFSKNHDISCNSCHDLARFGVDNEPTSPGHKGQRGGRNSPTTLNAAGHLAQFWDGREPTVEAQAKGPVLNPVEMAMPDEGRVLATINSIPEYVEAFKKAFPSEAEPVTYDNFGKAIGAFERKLVTPSAFDRYLKGDATALTDIQKEGLKAFVDAGCTTCHRDTYVGGSMYQKLGLVKPWPDLKDEGRKAHTGNDADLFMFKVPSLRNITKTGPYFHDGSVAELERAIKLMAEHQLGKPVTDAQVKAIAAFLDSLTGKVPEVLAKKPELPASTDKTPKPDPT